MNWFMFHLFSNYKVITEIDLELEFITKSGKSIMNENHKFILKKPIIKNLGDYAYLEYMKLDESFRNVFNAVSEECLNKNRKKDLINLNKGVIIPGSYIVCCKWYASYKTRPATWKEYKDLADIDGTLELISITKTFKYY